MEVQKVEVQKVEVQTVEVQKAGDAGWDQDEDVQIEFDEAKLLLFL